MNARELKVKREMGRKGGRGASKRGGKGADREADRLRHRKMGKEFSFPWKIV